MTWINHGPVQAMLGMGCFIITFSIELSNYCPMDRSRQKQYPYNVSALDNFAWLRQFPFIVLSSLSSKTLGKMRRLPCLLFDLFYVNIGVFR